MSGPLGIFGGSCGVLRAPAEVLEGSRGFIGELLCDLRGLLVALEGQKKSRKPPKKVPSGDRTFCDLGIRRQYCTVPCFFGRRRRKKAQAGGRPGGMQERPGRTPGGARSSKTCRFERILPGSLLVPQSNTPPRGRRIAPRIPPGRLNRQGKRLARKR